MARLAEIRVILFDLDNTLYPPDAGLIEAGDRLIADFIARRLDLPWGEADELRVRLWLQYGATARGLEVEYGIPQREYFAESLECVEVSRYINPDPELAALLALLPLRRFVFTNSPEVYAARVLDALGVRGLFEGVFHIESAAGRPKPDARPYDVAVRAIGEETRHMALVDDTEANLAPAAASSSGSGFVPPSASARRKAAMALALSLIALAQICTAPIKAIPYSM